MQYFPVFSSSSFSRFSNCSFSRLLLILLLSQACSTFGFDGAKRMGSSTVLSLSHAHQPATVPLLSGTGHHNKDATVVSTSNPSTVDIPSPLACSYGEEATELFHHLGLSMAFIADSRVGVEQPKNNNK
ncbi:hypothetical protein GQ43DRAFT_190659 [Delitschia confertaspora ATCC 74209]|uniref:Uncharacterized protein n=1 Tax=Delitschia confertaspora ATCC 74209 TaxID=1513339 RepID=A0A9P4MM17_9PLEO|nr:hypothetical protein GQ43DRAFT_190659 [Delitschia confertaspora ATCC 74209]